MKVVFALATFLTLGTVAQAKITPFETPTETPRPTPILEDSGMFVGPAGAMLESDYFRAPTSPFSKAHVCRLQLRVFEKTLLARSCN